ncbi:MAG: hypothetical protein ACUVXA_03365, partial [Candidatus Jordarchaeum sp.]|uniref:hypothetical protein n=1 Tax=Candidatus Jordarchaeum sp. TaxID=2823881 RepID=UPI00404B0369
EPNTIWKCPRWVSFGQRFPTIRDTRWLIFQKDCGEGEGKPFGGGDSEGQGRKSLGIFARTDVVQFRPGRDGGINGKSSFTTFFPLEGGEEQGAKGKAESSTGKQGGEGTGPQQGMKMLFGDQGDSGSRNDYRCKGEFTELVYLPSDAEAGDKTQGINGLVKDGEGGSEKTLQDAGERVDETSGVSEIGEGVSTEDKNSENAVERVDEASGVSETDESSVSETSEGTSTKEMSSEDTAERIDEISSVSEAGEDMSTEGGEKAVFVEVGEDESFSLKDVLRMVGEGVFRWGEEEYYKKLREREVELDREMLNEMLFVERRIPKEVYLALEFLAKEEDGEESDDKDTNGLLKAESGAGTAPAPLEEQEQEENSEETEPEPGEQEQQVEQEQELGLEDFLILVRNILKGVAYSLPRSEFLNLLDEAIRKVGGEEKCVELLREMKAGEVTVELLFNMLLSNEVPMELFGAVLRFVEKAQGVERRVQGMVQKVMELFRRMGVESLQDRERGDQGSKVVEEGERGAVSEEELRRKGYAYLGQLMGKYLEDKGLLEQWIFDAIMMHNKYSLTRAEDDKKVDPVERRLLEIWKRLGMNPDSKLAAAIEEIYEVLERGELLVFLYDGRVDPWGRRGRVASLVDVLEILVEAFRKAGGMEKFFEWVRRKTGRLIFGFRVNEEFARQRLDEEILRAALEYVYETGEEIDEWWRLLEQNTEYILTRLTEEAFFLSQLERLLEPLIEMGSRLDQLDQVVITEEHIKGKRKFTDKQLIELHKQGPSGEEVAEQLGVHRTTVFKHAKKLGIKFQRNAKRKFTDEQLTQLYKQGLTVKEIAKQLGVKGRENSYIYQHMRRLGLKTSARKFTDEQLIQLYERGLDVNEMAERLGVHTKTIYVHLRRLGLKSPASRKFADEQLIELHKQGLSQAEVAKQLGARKNTVYKRAKRLGIKFRCDATRKLKEKVEFILLKYFEHGWFTSSDVWEKYVSLFGQNKKKHNIVQIIGKIYGDGKNSILVRTGTSSNYYYRLRTEKEEEGLEDLERIKDRINSEEISKVLEWLLREKPVIEVSVKNFETYRVSGQKLYSLISRVLEKAGSQEKVDKIFDLTQLVEKIKSKNINLEELLKISEYLHPIERDKNPKIVTSFLIPFHEWAGGSLNPWPVLKLYEKTRIWETLHKIEHTLKVMGIKYLRTHKNTLLLQNPQNPWEAYEYGTDITTGEWFHQPTVKTNVETEGGNGLKNLLNQAVKKLEQQNKEPTYQQLALELNSLGADLNKGIIQEMRETGWAYVSDLYALFAFLDRENLHILMEKTIEDLLEKGKITKKESIILSREILQELNETLKKQGFGYLEKLAKMVDLSPDKIREYLRGRREIPIEDLEKICKNLGLETKFLKLHYRKNGLKLAPWDSYEKTTEIINENTIAERITITDPNKFEQIKLTFIHKRKDGEGVITNIPELKIKLSSLETPWYLQSPRTFIEIDGSKLYKDKMNIIQYMLKEGKKKAGSMNKLEEILKTAPNYFHCINESKLQVGILLKLALYTNTDINEIGKYITQVGEIKGKKGEVHTTSLDSPDGALFIAGINTDGHLTRMRYRRIRFKHLNSGFSNTEVEYIKIMQEASNRIYGYSPNKGEYVSRSRRMHTLFWYDAVSQTLLRAGKSLGKQTRKNTRVPEKIREGNKEKKIEFIRGLILSEGHPGKMTTIIMTRDIPISWQETKEILQQKGLNFNTPKEIEEYLKERQKRHKSKSDDKGKFNEEHRGIHITFTEKSPKLLEKEKHYFLEDSATMIKELLETEKEKINAKNKQYVKLKLKILEVRPYRVTGIWKITINSEGTRILHKILNGFPGYKELMYKNEEAVESYTQIDEEIKLKPDNLREIWNISNKRKTTCNREECYALSFYSLPQNVRDKFNLPKKILEKQRRIAQKTVELLVNGEKVKVKGMPSTVKCEVLLFPNNKDRYVIRWTLTRPKVGVIKKIWGRIKTIVKEKMARKESLEINMGEIGIEFKEG